MTSRRRNGGCWRVGVGLWAAIGVLAFPAMRVLGGEDAAAMVKEANALMRTAQRAMFSGKQDEAQAQLDAAAKLLEQARKVDPDYAGLKSVQSKFERQAKDLARRTGKTAAATKPAAPAAAGAGAGSSGEKLPGGITSRIKKIDQTLERAREAVADGGVTSTEHKRKQAAYLLGRAQGTLDEIKRGYGTHMDHPEVKAVLARIAGVEKQLEALGAELAAADEAEAASEARAQVEAAKWMAKLKPYVDFYGEKRLLTERTGTPANVKGQNLFFEEARQVLAECGKAAFPDGRLDELVEMQDKLAQAIETFPKVYKESLDWIAKEPDQNLGRIEGLVAERMAAKEGAKALPLSNAVIAGLRRLVTEYNDVVPQGDEQGAAFTRRLAAIESNCAKLRKRWVANTLMIADKFRGGDAATLKAKANAVVQKTVAGAKILRTTVISEDWNEERVLEWTDTTRSAVRYRVTRSVSAQVAAKKGGETFLYTLHLAQDKLTDGWGALRGHVMFTDPMLEENVKRTAP